MLIAQLWIFHLDIEGKITQFLDISIIYKYIIYRKKYRMHIFKVRPVDTQIRLRIRADW